jgi:hypothetical protein
MYIGLMTKPTTHFSQKQDRLLQDMDNLLDSDYWRDPTLLATLSAFLRRWGRVHTHNITLAHQGAEEHNAAFLSSSRPLAPKPEISEPQV